MAHLKPMPHSPSSSLFVCPADKPSMRAGDSTHKVITSDSTSIQAHIRSVHPVSAYMLRLCLGDS